MKKVVLKLDLHDDKVKQKAMKAVSGLSGVDSVAIDMKEKKMTVTGDVDPVVLVAKLRKFCNTDVVTVGPAKEPEKKKEEPKKDDKKDDLSQFLKAYHYQAYYNQAPPMPTTLYYKGQEEEDQNGCVIC